MHSHILKKKGRLSIKRMKAPMKDVLNMLYFLLCCVYTNALFDCFGLLRWLADLPESMRSMEGRWARFLPL